MTTTAKSSNAIAQSVESIGIIGAGNIGQAFAKALAQHGITATLANSRGPESLRRLAESLGATINAGTREDAASKALVLVAVPWSKLPDALKGLPDFEGRIVIDANNPIEAPLFRPADLGGRSSTAVFTERVPGARVVKAFNHLQPHLLSGDPRAEGGQRVLFYSGDDAPAKAVVGALIARLGFFGVDLGGLAEAARLTQFPGGPLPVHNFVRFG
jgi:predicted dinucleotide-binding enzyme